MSANLLNTRLPLARLLLIAPFFFWGTAMVAMKDVMPQTSPFFVAGIRLVPAGLLVLAIAAVLGKPQPQTWRAWGWISLFALVDGTLFQGFLVQGLARTGAGLGSVMIDSQPLAVALLAWWLYRERIGLWGWLGLGIGVAGISLIGLPADLVFNLAQNGWSGIDLSNLFRSGLFWMVLAALSMAIGTVMMQQVSRHSDPVVATGWHMILGGLPLFLASGLGETGQWELLTLSDWLNLAYATLFGSAIAYGLFFYFASKGNLTSLSSLTFLTPVFALIFGNLLLEEVLTPLQFGGVGLTLVSIYLVNQRQQLEMLLQRSPVRPHLAVESSSLELPVQVRISEPTVSSESNW